MSVPADFVVLYMGLMKTPLILRRPFPNTMNDCIYVGSGQIKFRIEGRSVHFLPLRIILTNIIRKLDPRESHSPPSRRRIKIHRKRRTNPPNHNPT